MRLIPVEGQFFEIFETMALKVKEGADELVLLMKDMSDVDARAGRIVDIEHEGDELTHEVMRRLNTTFITPFDRTDIHQLASTLDDVLDHIEAAAEYVQLHRVEQSLPQVVRLAETLAQAASVTASSITKLRKLKGLEEYWIELNRLENEGDRMYRRMIAELFSGDYKAMDVLKWKDIIEEIEQGIDDLENVANTVEGIALKQG
jgi:predicted phosphate transport protein (TIGR00153 family)